MRYSNSMLDLIGNTPLVKLNKFSSHATLLAKCEFMNPFSLKDRPMLNIITQAEKAGKIKPGDTLIEMTSGNTGMALAYISALKGYKLILCMSAIQSVERRKVMKALGAKLELTDPSLGTKGAKIRMNEIRKEHPEYFYVGQHINMDNPNAHYKTTGPELWKDTEGTIDILVAGLGTGGTICGTGKYLKEQNPDIRLVAIEPESAPFISQGIFTPHRMMGTAPGFVPETLDRDIIDEIMLVKEEDAFAMCRQLAGEEGILVGITSGAVACVLKTMGELIENKGKTIVGIFADSGERYLSVEDLFNS
ncbi:cysteine synthase A [Desulforhopalus sp. IMCC35007]|uniref:cysteine synthase A n=1 Tax=Desulforhopalus sp. IMCC35007 TaxID=2569543 RepID=UPI0010ADD928|nr:cysteine synthase A [Desulforhopalus sp. IMCC35007]TKB06592.1 cysteine synthase A [Desulforhopalus sp. IMCC35007]